MNTCITASCYDTLETIGVKEHSQQIERLLVCITQKAAAGKKRVKNTVVELLPSGKQNKNKINTKYKDRPNK